MFGTKPYQASARPAPGSPAVPDMPRRSPAVRHTCTGRASVGAVQRRRRSEPPACPAGLAAPPAHRALPAPFLHPIVRPWSCPQTRRPALGHPASPKVTARAHTHPPTHPPLPSALPPDAAGPARGTPAALQLPSGHDAVDSAAAVRRHAVPCCALLCALLCVVPCPAGRPTVRPAVHLPAPWGLAAPLDGEATTLRCLPTDGLCRAARPLPGVHACAPRRGSLLHLERAIVRSLVLQCWPSREP